MKPAALEFVLHDVPLPPPANNAFVNVPGVGRVRSSAYKAWTESAGLIIKSKKASPIEGAYSVTIVLPRKTRGDVDGRIKGILDVLVSLGLTPDDKHCEEVTCRRGDISYPHGGCMVIVRAVKDQQGRAA